MKNASVSVKNEESEYGMRNGATKKLRGEHGRGDVQVNPRQTCQSQPVRKQGEENPKL